MKPRYPDAARTIREWIASQKLPLGARLPSSVALSKQTGIPRFTIDRACHDLVTRGLLSRSGYKHFVGAGRPSGSPIQGVVYVLSYLESYMRTIGRILTERGVNHRTMELSLINYYRSPLPALRKVFAEKPAGVILWLPGWVDGLEKTLASETTPLVICADGVPPDARLHVVGTDCLRGVELAVRHLFALGHRHIAHVRIRSSLPFNRLILEAYRRACLLTGLRSSAAAIWKADSDDEEDFRATMLEQHRKHPEVTALFSTSGAAVATKTFRVPEEMSVVGMYAQHSTCRPRLTTVDIRADDGGIFHWACTDIITQIQAIESGRPPKPPRHVFFMPDLIIGESTRALTPEERGLTKESEGGSGAVPHGSLSAPTAKIDNPWESWRKTYRFLGKGGPRNWRQLDLSKLANHSLTREHGWLGAEPLAHFSPGLRSIHGIPFQVIDEYQNGGRAVVTFLSPHTRTSEGRELPRSTRLPVGARIKALYFLHGCGWAKSVPFAKYIMRFTDGTTAEVPLVASGQSQRLARKRLGRMKPNIQDWWPLEAPRDFSHAMFAAVFNPSDLEDYERYLYTLEWINPSPGRELSRIEVRVDPKAGPTLALVAVTALLA